MKKKIWSVTFWATAILVVAAFLACQSDVTEPTQTTLNEDDAYPAIYGYCKDAETGQPIYMAWVAWRSPLGELGYCITRLDGWYRIMDATEAWEVHEGQDLEGKATHDLYDDAYAYIGGYEHLKTYRRDFEMDPNPGHGELETNGLFQAYVRDAETGEGIYPAMVDVVGYNDGNILGYDTT